VSLFFAGQQPHLMKSASVSVSQCYSHTFDELFLKHFASIFMFQLQEETRLINLEETEDG
jgi:hypothetical protein